MSASELAQTPHERMLASLELVPEPTTSAEGANGSTFALDDCRRICESWPPALQGGRNDQTYRLACQLRDYGADEHMAYQLIAEIWNPLCQPPLSDRELWNTTQSAYKTAQNAAGSKTPEAHFPVTMAAPSGESTLGLSEDGRMASKQKKTAVERALDCAPDLELWHDGAGSGYATIQKDGHAEHYLIRSGEFSSLFEYACFKKLRKVESEKTLNDAIRHLNTRAKYEGPQHRPWLRVAELDGSIYLDLCDSTWRAIEINAAGWRVVDNPPVRFVRNSDMLALPEPRHLEHSQALHALAEFKGMFRFADEHSWPLACMFILSAFRHEIDYPICLILGDHGAGKSGFMELLRALVDPNSNAKRKPPADDKAIALAGSTNRIPSWDNVSKLSDDLQDGFCRLSTGGSVGERQYYTNFGEVTLYAQAPSIINGITLGALRADFADRALGINFSRPLNSKEVDKRIRRRQFTELQPRLLGALCSAVSCALKREDDLVCDWKPRLSGAYTWALAAAPALGLTEKQIEQACKANARIAAEASLESSPLAQYVLDLMDRVPADLDALASMREEHRPRWPKLEIDAENGVHVWLGSADLLLKGARSARPQDSFSLPKVPRTVYETLQRHKSALEAVGITIQKKDTDRTNDCRPIRLEKRVTAWKDLI